jgi:Zn-finger nucleic acid-binding protein
MPCLVCGHTVQNLGVEGQRIFWCPRCGTVMTERGDWKEHQSPMLVERVRRCEETSIRTSVDSRTLRYAIPHPLWVEVCESVGLKAIGSQGQSEVQP